MVDFSLLIFNQGGWFLFYKIQDVWETAENLLVELEEMGWGIENQQPDLSPRGIGS